MIKIQINDPVQKKQEYLNVILDKVASRISVLQQSLSHLNGGPIDFSIINFQSIGPVTKKIIRIVGGGIATFDDSADYVVKVNNYLLKPIDLSSINIVGLVQFCNDMLANNNQQLSELLVCDAADLMGQNESILNRQGLNTIENIAVIRLAFDYSFANIADEIKLFFRTNKFVSACPYCNKVETIHYTNDVGEPVESFQLDHFYDKATYPLLAYSFFNLVPSDQTCNVINKGTSEFTVTQHLNPHEMGYENRIKFVPICLNPSFDVTKIEVAILENQGTLLYTKINGNNSPTVEGGDLGNLNVFKIRSKYKNAKHKAGKILEILHKEDKNMRHISKYLISLRGSFDINVSYIKWYEKEFDVCFKPFDFNEKAYSKFSRDIHDYYFNNNKSRFNSYISELIKEN